ncbi:Hypothetical predicted protein [Mytilus galloprovincialis]|uniref:Fibrinogen C-terminal domain-containing protein n=1 Tax=Mytilus galloprovincialis TaxID=29158 RepID=A0A8B6EXV1_MYTGA|nr:Hypothetical predicted protein [Mytilus galloprovincialis]
MTIRNADRNLLTTTSDSGVCFYGKTAERVLSILATGRYRSLLPSEKKIQDCSDLHRKHDGSGVYKIYPAGGAGFKAYCDMKTDGGGWTHRQDGRVDFYKGWEDYVNGFGNLKTEFWLGDSLKHHNNRPFSTKDKDSTADCADQYKGAWWYGTCHHANLNGLYLGNKKDNKGMRWAHWKASQSMKTTTMMIRRVRK